MAAAPVGRVFQFKLVLLGDSAVGKSSLVLRFVRGQFFEYQESTIGAAFLTQTVALNDTTVKFEIWDTAGQERYHSLAPMYYRGAAAAIVVYDITNRVRSLATCPAARCCRCPSLCPSGSFGPGPPVAPASRSGSHVLALLALGPLRLSGHFPARQAMGEGAAAAGQPQHRHCALGQQI